MRVLDISARDLAGAAAQWSDFITKTLGFDHDVTAKVMVHAGGGVVELNARDKFQQATDFQQRIGQINWNTVAFKFDDDWDSVCRQVWETLARVMMRDEREMRHGMQAMGHLLEGITYESAVGKMFAERLRAIRDDMGANLLEYQNTKKAA